MDTQRQAEIRKRYEERGERYKGARELLDKAKEENRELTSEEDAQVEAHFERCDELRDEIQTLESEDRRESRLHGPRLMSLTTLYFYCLFNHCQWPAIASRKRGLIPV